MLFIRNGWPTLRYPPKGHNNRPSMRTIEGSIHLIQTIKQTPHLKYSQSIAYFDSIMAGKARHVVSFIIWVRVILFIFLVVQLVYKKYKVFLFQLLTVNKRSLGYFQYCLFCLFTYFRKLPSLVFDLLDFRKQCFSIIVRKVAFIVSLICVLLRWVNHILQEEWLFWGCMLVNKVKIPLEVNQNESVFKIANDITNRKYFSVENWIIGIFIDYLKSLFTCILLLVILGHILRKLMTLRFSLHSDKNYNWYLIENKRKKL